MKKISVICCYNMKEKLKYLSDSLDMQTIKAEHIFIDNSKNRFSSAAKALNYGAKKASGDILFFCHQDIKFKDQDALKELVGNIEIMRNGDIGGVAGAVLIDGRKKTKTNITHSKEEKLYINASFDGAYIETDTIDECVIIMTKDTWKTHKFDENICNNWHLYGVEQCLYARLNGAHVYTFDARINHLSSTGALNKEFYLNLLTLIKRYKKTYPYILATTGYWPTRNAVFYIMKRIIGDKLRLLMHRQ